MSEETKTEKPEEKKEDIDLDKILDEIEKEEVEAKTDEKDEKPEKKDDDDRFSRLESELTELRKKETARDVDSALKQSIEHVKSALGDAASHYDDDDIEAHLRFRAEKDGRVMTAFGRSHKDPKGWNKVLDGFAADLAKRAEKRMSKTDDDDRSGREAAAKGVRTKAPPDSKTPTIAEIEKMTPAEYAQLQAQVYGDSYSSDGL